jgi:hypothetical protein
MVAPCSCSHRTRCECPFCQARSIALESYSILSHLTESTCPLRNACCRGDQPSLSFSPTCGVQLRRCAYTFEGQFSAIPPNSARIESPSATMSPSKPVVNDVRHKEWYRREVMAAFEAPVCGSKHEGGDSILRRSQ